MGIFNWFKKEKKEPEKLVKEKRTWEEIDQENHQKIFNSIKNSGADKFTLIISAYSFWYTFCPGTVNVRALIPDAVAESGLYSVYDCTKDQIISMITRLHDPKGGCLRSYKAF